MTKKFSIYHGLFGLICLMLALTAPAWAADGDPDPVGLVNGQATDLTLEADCNYQYYIDVPEGANELTVNLTLEDGSTAILYTRFGEEATQENYDCISDVGGDVESCVQADPTAGRWYIRVTTILAGPAKITATYYIEDGSGALPLFNNEQQALVLAEGSNNLFFFDVPEGANLLQAILNVSSGQARLYARAGQVPTVDDYDWASDPVGPGQEATISKKPPKDDEEGDDGNDDDGGDDGSTPENQAKYQLANPPAGRYYFLVVGLGDGEAGITASYDLSDDEGGNGGENAGELTENRWNTVNLTPGEKAVYSIEVPSGTNQFKVDMKTDFGEASLYTMYDQVPTLDDYDCSSSGQHGTVKCIHHFPQAGTWYIMVYGQSAAQVELKPLLAGD